MRCFLSISVFYVISVSVFAQSDYLVTTKGDTVYGKISINAVGPNDKEMFKTIFDRLKIVSEGKKASYTAVQVRSFIMDKNLYEPVRQENAYRFMRPIKGGYLSLYAYATSSTGSWEGRFLYKKTGQGIEVPHVAFKKMMSKFLADDPKLSERIETRELKLGDLEKIIDEYNAFASSKTPEQLKGRAEAIASLNSFAEKLATENFDTKEQAMEVLHDIQSKLMAGDPIKDYLIQALRKSLAKVTSLSQPLDALVQLLQK